MTEVVLDTDVFSYLADERSRAGTFAGHLYGLRTVLAFPTVAELHYGARRAKWGESRIRRLERDIARHGLLLPTEGSLRLCGRLRAEAVALGHPLGQPQHANDLWIAACAVHYDVPLLTGNERHFEGLPGLRVIPTA